MAVKWEVQIAGPKIDLDDLCAVFTSEALRLESRDSCFFLKSSQFELITDPQEVESRASELVSIISGASRLSLGSRATLRTSGVTRIDEDGKRHTYMFVSDTIHVNARATMEVRHADGTTTLVLPASSAPEWVLAALSNSAVAKALRLFGAGSESWVDLYRILEVVIKDVGGVESLIKRGWVTRSKVTTFKHTANSVSATGDHSRHGSEHTAPPSDPMSLEEAKSLVSVILHSWLQEKAASAANVVSA